MHDFTLVRGAAALVLAGLLAGCSNGSSGTTDPDGGEPTSKTTPKSELSPSAFASCDALKDYYSDALAEEILTQYRYGHCFGCEPGMPVPVADTAAQEDTGGFSPAPAPPSREVTETNTQEAGVDEADIIETNPNGTEIYVLRRFPHELLVIETADPANLSIISRTPLASNRQPRGMFFDPDSRRLAIILDQAYFYAYANSTGAPAMAVEDAAFAPPPFEQGTEIQFFDVSDPADPTLTETFVTDGFFIDARRIGDRVHLVSQFGFPYPESLYANEDFQQAAWQDYPQAWQAGDEDEIARLEALIRQYIDEAVAALDEAELLPQESTDAGGAQALACTRIEHPQVPTRLGLILISSIGMDGSAPSTIGSINNAWITYASSDNLYLLQTSGGWWFDPAQKQQSAIYRYDLSSGSAQLGSTVGVVDGWIGDRFWLSQFEDHLRVVSSEGRFASPDQPFVQHHHLTVLDTAGMNQTGRVASFVDVSEKPRETIRSARFVGASGYVVTFEQIDPLFTFDLSDPADPRKVAELEIPGFSTYMHPLGQTHLLTIGRNAGEGGVGVGRSYQLQVFDVSDLANPVQQAATGPMLGDDDYAYSLAEYDPHAFTYSEAAGLLSIPVQISSPDSAAALSGFIAYAIDVSQGENAIREYARIDHKDPPDDSNSGSGCPDARDEVPPEGCGSFAPVIYNEPLRSVIIVESGGVPVVEPASTTVLTLSSAKLKALDASGESGQELDTLPLEE